MVVLDDRLLSPAAAGHSQSVVSIFAVLDLERSFGEEMTEYAGLVVAGALVDFDSECSTPNRSCSLVFAVAKHVFNIFDLFKFTIIHNWLNKKRI